MIDNIFLDIGLIIIVATFFGFIARIFKQPLIPAYVVAGLVLGPILQIITNKSIIATLSEIGIAFLLFIVGLEIDIKKLKSVGLVSGLGGVIQSVTLFTLGFVVMLFLGFIPMEAAYIGIIIAFSSTMVVIKNLSDRRELDTMHGRLIIGFLLMEDFLAVLAISILGSLNDLTVGLLFVSIGKALLLFLLAWIGNKFIFPGLFKFSAKSKELIFLSAISVCFLFSLFFAYLGFSISIGAFAAGVTLANLPYGFEIIARVKSMRDFFATIFFVSLGTSIVGISRGHILALILLIAIIWLIKPFISVFITTFFGYRKRPAFLASINLAQTSEFSLIIATQGLILGHISQEILSITAILAVITMSATSYFMKYEYKVYYYFSGFLNRFDM